MPGTEVRQSDCRTGDECRQATGRTRNEGTQVGERPNLKEELVSNLTQMLILAFFILFFILLKSDVQHWDTV